TFTNQAQAWGLGQRGFSNGAAYVDLNNSGALDLVVNRIDAPAAIYRNRARELTGNHYLQVVLRGSGGNTAGIGAKVILKEGGKGRQRRQGRQNELTGEPLFEHVTAGLGIAFTHQETRFSDFHREPLIPHLLSPEGPDLAIGNVDGDGRDDIYVGGAKWQAG